MELIFYDEACKILEVKSDTLRHAISRGELTRAGLQGNRHLLIKEQVMLYAGINPRTGGKKRISYDGLTEKEQTLWHRYANELQNAETSSPSIDKETIAEIVRQEVAKQQLAAIEAREKEIAREKEGLYKDHPFLKRELLTA